MLPCQTLSNLKFCKNSSNSLFFHIITLVFSIFLCYNDYGATLHGRRLPFFIGGRALQSQGSNASWKGGMAMVTYDELFQFGLLIVAIVGLVYKITHKK